MFLARPNTISREHLVAIGKGRRKPDAPTPFRPRWRGFEKPHQKSEEAIFFARPGCIRRESFVTIGGGRRKPDAEPDGPTVDGARRPDAREESPTVQIFFPAPS